jgi:hypothetical protein
MERRPFSHDRGRGEMRPTTSKAASRSGRQGLLLAAVACVLATPVAAWWLTGDLSEPLPPGTAPDHLIRPPSMDPPVERVVGLGSVAVAGGTLALLLRASRYRWFDRRWWAALLPAMGVGALAGLGCRVATAAVIGANIGAGLMLMLAGPLVALLLLWIVSWSVHILRSPRRTPDRRAAGVMRGPSGPAGK